MSVESALRNRRVLRLAVGTAASLWVSQAVGWPLSFIAPILTMSLLALPVSRPKPKFFIIVFLALVVSVWGSFLLLPVLLHYRVAGLLLLALALFHCFYFTARGGAAVVGTLLTIGLTVMVAVGSVSVDALIAVAQGVTAGALVGAGAAWLAHGVLPDPIGATKATESEADDAAKPVPERARHNAFRSLAIVLPITIWFLLSSASAANTAVMIKVASMGQEASAENTRAAARSLLFSTVAGGVAAAIAWQALSVWPSLTLYTLIMLAAGLFFGNRVFSSRVAGESQTWSYAFLTMIVILAPAVLDSQFGTAAGARFYDRLWMFAGASVYGIAAVYIFDAFFSPMRRAHEFGDGKPTTQEPALSVPKESPRG